MMKSNVSGLFNRVGLSALAAGVFALSSVAMPTISLAGDVPTPKTAIPTKEELLKKAAAETEKVEKAAKDAKEAKEKAEKEAKEKAEKESKDKKGVTAGDVAPNFTLTDTDGKSHSLADMTKAGKIVVIQWFNPACPFVVKHYGETKTFNDLAAKYKDKGVEFVAINSGAAGKEGSGLERNKTTKTDWLIPYPILMDESGKVGKLFGAKRTPEMFIIGKDGKVAYHGAIDDDREATSVGKTNYVSKALDELIDGKAVSSPTTRSYGCTVKYKD